MAVRPNPRLLPRAASAPRPRRSAVERLEESKANYVKSGHLRQQSPRQALRSEPPRRQLSLQEPSLEDQLRRLLAAEDEEPTSPDDPQYCSLTTSDYVSRSSSSHRAPSFVPPLTPHKAAVTRSKSDVAHRPSPPPSALFALQKRNSYSSAELEHYLAVEPEPVMLPPSPAIGAGSPYSSMNTTSSTSGSSLDSDLPPSTSQLSSLDFLRLRAPEPPASIVEKNARVIKWLYGCRRAQEFPEPAS